MEPCQLHHSTAWEERKVAVYCGFCLKEIPGIPRGKTKVRVVCAKCGADGVLDPYEDTTRSYYDSDGELPGPEANQNDDPRDPPSSIGPGDSLDDWP
jgi:hypothetical protein